MSGSISKAPGFAGGYLLEVDMRRLLKYLLYALTAFSIAGLFSSFVMLLDLFNHFRVHALIASIVLGVGYYSFDRDKLKFPIILLAINAILFSIPLFKTSGIHEFTPEPSALRPLRIAFSNVYANNKEFEKTVETLTSEDPDVIALVEINERWIANLSSLDAHYPYRLTRPRSGNFGMAIYSRLPFSAKMLDVGTYGLPLAIMDFEKFKFIVAHPFPPISPNAMMQNEAYLVEIARNVRKTSGPVIVAGDLNGTLWGNALKPLFDVGLKRINASGIAYTWPAHMAFLAIQIDHFFARGLSEANFRVLPDMGSDHYPIEALIKLP
jgi:endonuclease/exonuclease/phosphatase (EEP) superfamily protein YafD